MNARFATMIVALLFVSFLAADLSAQSRGRRNRTSKNLKQKEKPLLERDPELHSWITTLVGNLQKSHRKIRNSAAQALISVGADAAPMLVELRERTVVQERRLINRILERITRSSGKNLFKTDAGGGAPATLSRDIGAALKLDKSKTERLTGVISRVQEKKRAIDRAKRKKEIDQEQRNRKMNSLLQEVQLELGLFLDHDSVEYVTLRLGINSAAEKRRSPKEVEEDLGRRRRRDSGRK